MVRLDGKPAVGLVVYKDAGANTVNVTAQLDRSLATLRQEFPQVEIHLVAAQAAFVRAALSNLWQEIIVGGILSILVILLFLRDLRMSLAIGVMVPLSVFVSLTLMQLFHVTINILSLGGLALAVGMLVDNSIVVAEATERGRHAGAADIGVGPRCRRRSECAADRRHPHHGAGLRPDRLRAGACRQHSSATCRSRWW